MGSGGEGKGVKAPFVKGGEGNRKSKAQMEEKTKGKSFLLTTQKVDYATPKGDHEKELRGEIGGSSLNGAKTNEGKSNALSGRGGGKKPLG